MEEGNSRLYDIRIGVKESNHGLGRQLGPQEEDRGCQYRKANSGRQGPPCPFRLPCAVVLGRDGCQGAGDGSGREHGEHVIFAGNANCGCCVHSQAVGDRGQVKEGQPHHAFLGGDGNSHHCQLLQPVPVNAQVLKGKGKYELLPVKVDNGTYHADGLG